MIGDWGAGSPYLIGAAPLFREAWMRTILLGAAVMMLAGCATPNQMAAMNAAQERQLADMAGREAPPPWSLRRPANVAPGWGSPGYGGYIYKQH